MRAFFLALAAFLVALSGSAAKAEDVYHFDKSHTSILFFINHLGLSNMVGEFHGYEGQLTIDPARPENSALEVMIDPVSVDTDVPELDKKLLGEDFFNTQKFPQITFRSTSVMRYRDDKAKVTGDLSLLGVTKPVTLDVTLNKETLNKYSGKYVMGFSATATLKRSDFGMDYGVPDVGDEIRLVIETEMQKEEPEGSPVRR